MKGDKARLLVKKHGMATILQLRAWFATETLRGTCVVATILLTGVAGLAHAKPDLSVTQVEIACISLIPVAPGPMPTRYIHRRCDTDHQVELSVTIENVGDADAVLNGELWNLVGQSAPVTAFAQSAQNLTYYPPISVTQAGPLRAYPITLPKARNTTLKPGIRLTEVVVMVPVKQLTVGSHSFSVRIDPQNKVDEANEANDSRSLTLVVATPPPNEEWVNCPSVGVSALVEPALDQGKVRCTYLNTNRPSETLVVNFVESQYLKPFRACLRSNAQYEPGAPRGGAFTSRMYCSFTKNAAALVEGATAWRIANLGGRRVRLGYRSLDGVSEDFEICRARYDGSLRVGRGWRGRCYVPYKNAEQRIDQGIEYLVLTQAYGVPSEEFYKVEETRNIQPVVDPSAPEAVQLRFCAIGPMFPNDVAQALGLAPNLMIKMPGVLVPGEVCLSSAQGKAVTVSRNQGFGVLILR